MLEDAALIRYVDGESPVEERALIDAAAAADTAVAERLDALRRRSARLRSLLAAGDPAVPDSLIAYQPDGRTAVADAHARPQPGGDTATGAPERTVIPLRTVPPRARPAWLRAAIIVVLVGAAMLAVPPVRAWIIDGLQRIGVLDAVPQPAPAPDPVRVDTLEIRGFDAAGDFTIELEHAQTSGQLVVRIAAVAEALAELHTRGESASPLFLPDGLRIANHDSSTADYVVTLPIGLRTIRVRIPGVTDTTWTPAGPAEHRFDLRR